jgi:hypothetical protein
MDIVSSSGWSFSKLSQKRFLLYSSLKLNLGRFSHRMPEGCAEWQRAFALMALPLAAGRD